jgi:eukaryotic translation initiation factor 2C
MVQKIPELQLVMIIVSRKDSAIYSEVKRIGDTEVGIMTQVLCAPTMQKAMKSPSTMINILMKINTKVGGQNVSIPSRFRSPIMSEPVIVLGADVTHPAAGEFTRPSIAAIVGPDRQIFYQSYFHSIYFEIFTSY